MKVLVLGENDYCGWPTSLHLSDAGHEAVIVGNFARRQIDQELGTKSPMPIVSPAEHVRTWSKVSSASAIANEEHDSASRLRL